MGYPRQNLQNALTQFENDIKAEKFLFTLENKINFENQLSKGRYEDFFIDYLGKDFGHLTGKGAKLIAEKVFQQIEILKSRGLCGL